MGDKAIVKNDSHKNRAILAAVLAENGEYEGAVREQIRAIRAVQGEDKKQIREYEKRLRFFQMNKPFRLSHRGN